MIKTPPKYYSLVENECDELTAMFPVTSNKYLKENNYPYLVEFHKGEFLYKGKYGTDICNKIIHCPYCGYLMEPTYIESDDNSFTVYLCDECIKNKYFKEN